MKANTYIYLLTAILFLLPTGLAVAGDDSLTVDSHGMLLECDDKTRENHLYLMNAEKLGLSAEQIKQLRDIKGDCDNLCIADKVRLRTAKVELSEILGSENIDMALAREKIKRISELQDSMRVRHLKTRVQAIMVLDEGQKEKVKSLK